MNSDKVNEKHSTTIKKGSLGWWNWKIYKINQNNILISTSINNQPSPSPWTSWITHGKKIRMSSLDMDHRKFDITPEEKYQDQWTMIQLKWARVILGVTLGTTIPRSIGWESVRQCGRKNNTIRETMGKYPQESYTAVVRAIQ